MVFNDLHRLPRSAKVRIVW